MQKNHRRGEARFGQMGGDASKVNRKYAQNLLVRIKSLTQHVRIGLDWTKAQEKSRCSCHRRLRCGQTRFYANLILCRQTRLLLFWTQKGGQVRAVGNLLREKGYEVKSPRPYKHGEEPLLQSRSFTFVTIMMYRGS